MIKTKDILVLIRFGFAGIAGFLVDSIVVVIAIHVVGLGPIVAQAIAFTIAITVTWLINRHWAFSDYIKTSLVTEWSSYVAADSVGALVNNRVYVGLVAAVRIF